MAFAQITGDPAGNARNDDERTTFDILNHACKVPAVPADTNDITMRREAFASPMTRIIDGEPGMLIHPQCKRLRKALAGGYHYKRVAVSGQDRYHDQPDKNMHSHVADAGQYLVLGMGGAQTLKRIDASKRGPRPVQSEYRVLG